MKHLLFVLLLCGVVAAEPSPAVDYLRNEPMTMWDLGMWRLKERVKEFKFVGYSPLSIRDIKDWPDFVSKLISAKNADRPSPGKRIWTLLPPSTQGILKIRASTKFTHKWPRFRVKQSALADSLQNEEKAKFYSKIEIEREDKSNIINELNQVLNRRNFYQEEDFYHLTLTEEILELLSRRDRDELSKNNVQKLNRLLLETAYPYNLAKSLEAPFNDKGAGYDLDKNLITIFVEDSVRRETVQEAKTACKNIIADLQWMFGISPKTGNPYADLRSSLLAGYFSHQGFNRLDEPNDLGERLDEMVELNAFVGSQIMCHCKLRSTNISFVPDAL